MATNIYNVVIEKVSYFFDKLGTVIPKIKFTPDVPLKIVKKEVELVTDTVIVTNPSQEFGNEFRIGNTINVKLVKNDQLELLPNYDIEITDDYILRCPICGEQLIDTPNKIKGIGRCVNRGCCGQLREVIYNFLNQNHIELTFIQRQILDTLLQTGGIISLPQLWMLTSNMLHRYGISSKETYKFLYLFKYLRKKLNLMNIFLGLGIYAPTGKFSTDTSSIVEAKKFIQICKSNKVPLIRTLEFYENNSKLFEDIDTTDLDEFLLIQINRYIFNELCRIFS